jgi:hypothetical protein
MFVARKVTRISLHQEELDTRKPWLVTGLDWSSFNEFFETGIKA